MIASNLQISILKTLAYFDLFDYPLTKLELWKWLWCDTGESARYDEIDKAFTEEEAFLYFKNRQSIIATREERHIISITKVRRACRVARLFRWLPYIQGIAICNSLGYRNARQSSDIDFFIITSSGAIWLTRFLTTFITLLFRLRPQVNLATDKICLSFFVSCDSLDLSCLKKGDVDPYLTYWVATLLPIFGRGNIWQDFFDTNHWVKEKLPNILPISTDASWRYIEAHSTRLKAYWITRTIDKFFERWQRWYMPVNLKIAAEANNNNVVITSNMLKFHLNDRREKYKKRWEEKIKHVA